MEYILPIAGIAIAVAMGAMYLTFGRAQEDPASWLKTLDRYRVVWRTVLAGTLFLAMGFLFIATSFDGDALFSNDTIAVPILFLFFVGVIRLFVERASGERESLMDAAREFWKSFLRPRDLKEEAKVIRVSRDAAGGNNVWIWFFGLSIGFAIVDATLGVAGCQLGDLAVYLLPLVSTIGFACWIYMLLFRKLTDQHHLNSLAARIFLGEVFTSELPKQVMMIGPPASGKTTLIGSRTDTDPSQNVTTMLQPVFVEELNRTVTLSMIDCPGEKMRDHVLLASAFRADVLVFMLRGSWLDPESVGIKTTYVLDRWERLVTKDNVKAYLRAFHFATHGDGVVDVAELFKVRSFVLYLNVFNDEEPPTPSGLDVDRLKDLAAEIGRRFGVEPEHCHCIAGDASQAGQGRDLLGGEERLAKAASQLSATVG